jgi:hypothetical protein
VGDIYAYMKKLTIESFILKSKNIHGDKYDYSKADYVDSHSKVKIICNTHGIFEQKAYCHLNGEGCRKCSDELKFQKRRHTTDNFIEKAIKKHGDKYNYSLVNYRNARTKVEIICPKHGIFKQTAPHHLNGIGCPTCKSSKGELFIEKFLTEEKIKYIRQHIFEECKNIRPLPFDFYLPELNICVEYDGRHHFEPIELWGGKKSLDYTINNDKIKENYCLNNFIKLIRISYKEDLEKKLISEINNKNKK